MNSVALASSDYVKITNPTIISFYETNKHIGFETVNLLLLDMLQQVSGANWQGQLKTKLESYNPEDKQKIDELRRFQTQLREDSHQTILLISSQFGSLKNTYIQEFRAVFPPTDSESIVQLLAENNARFNEKMKVILSEILKIRANGIADKTNNMLRQFQTILTANIQSVLSKDPTNNLERDFVDNYDTNSTCMINAILQLLSDYVAQKDTQISQIIESIQRQEMGISATYYKLIYELNDVLHQLHHDSDNANGNFDTTLFQIFPTATITSEQCNPDSENAHTKYTILREEGTVPILIESHQIRDKNVGITEIKSFFKSADEKMAHSVLISQFTGITGKPNYHLEIQHNRILVFLHKTEFSAEKVQHAIDMINTLSAKLGDLCLSSENKYAIPREVLDDINREYQHFIIQKDTITALLKDQHKKLLGQMDEMRFCSLDKFLSTRYSSCKKQGYLCDLCNVFTVGTLKGLAAHKRGCARKKGVCDSSTQPIPTIEKIGVQS